MATVGIPPTAAASFPSSTQAPELIAPEPEHCPGPESQQAGKMVSSPLQAILSIL